MPIIEDNEFGKITVRRSPRSTQIRIKVAPDGSLRASIPLYAPLFLVKRLINSSKNELKKALISSQPKYNFYNGMQIGKSHTLIIHKSNSKNTDVIKHGQQIIVKLSDESDINDDNVVKKLRSIIITSLRLEARSYLPNRLKFLSHKLDIKYSRVRFSHSSGRWGSCSSNGTISLNIALMKLPFNLIDYVLIHELCHIKQMNHSKSFWELVEKADSKYLKHRTLLKLETPTI